MAKRLAALYDLAHELCGQLSVSEITGTFLDVVFEVFTKADRSIVLLEDRDTHKLVPVAARERGTSSTDITVSQTIIDMVLEEKHAVICGDTSSDARFKHSASLQDLKIKSIMCVPLLVSDQVLERNSSFLKGLVLDMLCPARSHPDEARTAKYRGQCHRGDDRTRRS